MIFYIIYVYMMIIIHNNKTPLIINIIIFNYTINQKKSSKKECLNLAIKRIILISYK